MKVNAGLLPLPLHGAFGDFSQASDLAKGEPAEEFQVDDLRQVRLNLREFIERIGDFRKLLRVGWIAHIMAIGRRNLKFAATFERGAASGVINDDSPHDARGISHEAGLVWK